MDSSALGQSPPQGLAPPNRHRAVSLVLLPSPSSHGEAPEVAQWVTCHRTPGLQCGPSWSPLGCSNTSSPLTRDVAKGQGLHGHSWLSSCPAVVSGASLRATLVGAAAELESAASQPNDLGRVPPPSECTFPPPSGGVMLSASLGYCGSDAGSFKVLARMQKNGILVHCWREREMA